MRLVVLTPFPCTIDAVERLERGLTCTASPLALTPLCAHCRLSNFLQSYLARSWRGFFLLHRCWLGRASVMRAHPLGGGALPSISTLAALRCVASSWSWVACLYCDSPSPSCRLRLHMHHKELQVIFFYYTCKVTACLDWQGQALFQPKSPARWVVFSLRKPC